MPHTSRLISKSLLIVTFLSVLAMALTQEHVKPKDESSKNLSRWESRWAESRIRWHQADPHHFLLKHGSHLNIENFADSDTCSAGETENECNRKQARIFFPLCGKTVDMAFLSKHQGVSEVVGVDGIRKALEEFIDENPQLQIEESQGCDAFERFEGHGISLLKGDFFDLDDNATNGKFDGIFDRGSLVAIDPSLRKDYVNILGKLIKPGGSILMATVDRREGTEEAKNAGPPFSVDGDVINKLFGNLEWVESITKLDELDEFQDEDAKKKWEMQGIDSLYEIVYVVKAVF